MLPATQRIANGEDCIINSPLLSGLLDTYTEESYYEILDLMPASPQVVDFFSSYHCKLFLPGGNQSLCDLSIAELDTETRLNRALIKTLGFKKQNKAALDLVLLWDLPNYLEPDLLRALIVYLLPHCSPDVILHTYINTREQMPARPGIYKLQSDKRVVVEQDQVQMRVCPMYYQESLQKVLSPFLVKRGILLSSGMQEYILYRR